MNIPLFWLDRGMDLLMAGNLFYSGWMEYGTYPTRDFHTPWKQSKILFRLQYTWCSRYQKCESQCNWFTKDTAQLLDILNKIMQVLACSGHKSGPFCANMKGHLCNNVFPPDEQPLYMEINSTHCTSSNSILSLSEFLPYGHDRKLNCLMHTQNRKTILAIWYMMIIWTTTEPKIFKLKDMGSTYIAGVLSSTFLSLSIQNYPLELETKKWDKLNKI